jgi:pyruvate/2-oxoglutarate/acetoin dehydrogenase E1 component
MRDNHQGFPEIRQAYERDGLYFGVVRVETKDEAASFEFGVEYKGYLALRRILESRPFDNLLGIQHRYFYAGRYSRRVIGQEPVTIGIRIVYPSNAVDAAGLLRTAIRCDDPVMFLEHKRLYRETFGRAPYPGADYMIPFGKAKVVQQGSDMTVVTYGATVPRSLQAAQRIEREHGVKVEVIDLRSLNPFDWETVAGSVGKTNRVLVVHEDTLSWGYGAEIAARIADELFDDLDAPVKRVAAKDTFVAYQPQVEDAILPQPDDIYQAMLKLSRY